MKRHLKKSSAGLFIFLAIFFSTSSYCQEANAYGPTMSLLLFHGGYEQANNNYLKGDGYIIISDSVINGNILLTTGAVIIKTKQHTLSFSYENSSLLKVSINTLFDTLNLVRLKNVKNQLWRIIKDTLGLKIIDKNFTQRVELNSIDYNSLAFCKNNVYKEAFDFWTTSTKKNIVRILNDFLNISLHPKKFNGKEDILERILLNDKSFYSSM